MSLPILWKTCGSVSSKIAVCFQGFSQYSANTERMRICLMLAGEHIASSGICHPRRLILLSSSLRACRFSPCCHLSDSFGLRLWEQAFLCDLVDVPMTRPPWRARISLGCNPPDAGLEEILRIDPSCIRQGHDVITLLLVQDVLLIIPVVKQVHCDLAHRKGPQ
jgi:hypothetical protein